MSLNGRGAAGANSVDWNTLMASRYTPSSRWCVNLWVHYGLNQLLTFDS